MRWGERKGALSDFFKARVAIESDKFFVNSGGRMLNVEC
jgi:hypothetical protein